MPPAFGGYQVLHQLGSGTLGPVFRAHDPATDRIVAVKAFALALIPEDALRLSEALRTLVAVGAPHRAIASPVDAGLEGTTPYLVSEFVPGETLDVAMRRLAPSRPKFAIALLTQLAEALDAAWARGVGHGMLHPRDIFVLPDRQTVRLTGVGWSGALDSVGIKLPVRRPYTSPERIASQDWDARADVFGLAAIAHELLTGRRPVGSGEQDSTFARGVGSEERAGLGRVLASALAADLDDRFDSVGAFVAALAEAAEAGQMVLPITEAGAYQSLDADMGIDTDTDADADVYAHADVDERRVDVGAAVDEAAEAPEAPVRVVGPAEVAGPELPEAFDSGDKVEAPSTPDADWDVDEFDAVSVSAGGALFGHELPGHDAPSEMSWTRGWMAAAAVAVVGAVLVTAAVLRFGPDVGSSSGPAEFTSVEAEAEGESEPRDRAAEPMPASDPGDTEVNLLVESADPAPIASQPAVERPPAPVQRVAAPVGQLVVTSEPAGALVMIDGRLRGETPATVRDLALGAHTVLVARPGFAPSTQEVTLAPGSSSRTLSVSLQAGVDPRPAIRGTIVVDSRPRGARVFVDGRPVGVTPLARPGVAPGRHSVRLELVGYRAVSTSVDVGGGRRSRVAVTLEPAPRGGRR